MTRAHRIRLVVNWMNLSTLLGLLLAGIGRARIEPGPEGLIIARAYRLPVPPAPAFTVGNVVVFRLDDARVAQRPTLLRHEGRHATQYAWCLGPVMLVLYALAALWSLIVSGDPASRNVFERRAGLKDGGYLEKPLRRPFRRPTRSGRV